MSELLYGSPARDDATSRAQSMKSLATGPNVRFFKVTILVLSPMNLRPMADKSSGRCGFRF
jgi:hypothetical protein